LSLADAPLLSSNFLNSLFEVAVHERMQTRPGDCALSAPNAGFWQTSSRRHFTRLRMKLMRELMTVAAVISAAAPALASDEQDCFQGREPELKIKGCSQLIQRAPDDAIAYHNRAVAYGLAGDIDNAIASLIFTSGKLGVVDLTRSGIYGYDISTEILGLEGTIRIGYLRETPITILTKANGVSHDTVPYFMERFRDAYTNQLQNFAQNVLQGKPAPITIDDGLEALRVGVAATRARESGTSVTVADVK